MAYSNHVIAPLLTPLSQDFGVGMGVVGLVASAYGLAGIPMGVLVGPYSDRFGRKPFLLGGALLIGGFNIACAFAPTFPLVVLARGFAGFGAVMVFASLQASLGDIFPYGERGRAQATLVIVNQAGPLLGLPLAGFLAQAFSWRLVLALVGALALAACLVIWRRLPAGPRASSPLGRGALYGMVLRSPPARSTLASFVLSQLSWWAWATYLVVFIERSYGLSPALAATVALSNALGIAAGSVLGGRIGASLANRNILIPVSSGVAALSLFATHVSTPLWLGAVLFFVLSTLIGMRFLAITVVLTEQVPAARGTITSLMASTNGVGQSVGPAAAGLLVDRSGFGMLGIWCALATIGSMAFFLGEKRSVKGMRGSR